MSRHYHTASGMLRTGGDALPALSNPRMEAIVEGWPVGRQRCRAWFAVESGPRGERASRRTENKARTGWNAPKRTAYAARVRIADGDDGRTYIVRDVRSHINVMGGDMEHDIGNVWPDDPRHADLLSLFGAPGGGTAVTACKHGQFLTEETCADCLTEAKRIEEWSRRPAERPRKRRPRPAPAPAEALPALAEEAEGWLWPGGGEYVGMDEIDLEAERLGRGIRTGPERSWVRQRSGPAERRRGGVAGIARRIAERTDAPDDTCPDCGGDPCACGDCPHCGGGDRPGLPPCSCSVCPDCGSRPCGCAYPDAAV